MVARARFEEGYGSLDLTHETDVGLFLRMLEDEIRQNIERDFVVTIKAATERIRGELNELQKAA